MAPASAVECTATVRMPISWQARWMRSAISPRLAIRTFPIFMRRYSTIISGSPYSTGVPGSTRIRVTVPARGALIWLKVFIASISSRVWPCGDLGAERDEGRLARLGRQIGDADHGGGDQAGMLGSPGSPRRRVAPRLRNQRRRRGGGWRGLGLLHRPRPGHVHRRGRRRYLARHADAAVLLDQLDLGQVRCPSGSGARRRIASGSNWMPLLMSSSSGSRFLGPTSPAMASQRQGIALHARARR